MRYMSVEIRAPIRQHGKTVGASSRLNEAFWEGKASHCDLAVF
jgi:hypothetical protein